MPKMEKVYLHNPSSEEISLISISATTAHFHASFFQNRVSDVCYWTFAVRKGEMAPPTRLKRPVCFDGQWCIFLTTPLNACLEMWIFGLFFFFPFKFIFVWNRPAVCSLLPISLNVNFKLMEISDCGIKLLCEDGSSPLWNVCQTIFHCENIKLQNVNTKQFICN